MKKIILLCIIALLSACSNDDMTFSLKTIKLNDFKERTNLPSQKLYLKVFKNDSEIPLSETGFYPSEYTMPATFKVYPVTPMQLYGKDYNIQLWGEINGYLGRCDIDMDEYKIIFPIDMEIQNDSLSVSILGSWE
ncbi:hypothetical protein [Flavobacterium adhaerens]|uniref:hypothetical protein n=1 Tax=Flavobacterium adhaerens TaxID=3149043 RepID=UPI0032B571BE